MPIGKHCATESSRAACPSRLLSSAPRNRLHSVSQISLCADARAHAPQHWHVRPGAGVATSVASARTGKSAGTGALRYNNGGETIARAPGGWQRQRAIEHSEATRTHIETVDVDKQPVRSWVQVCHEGHYAALRRADRPVVEPQSLESARARTVQGVRLRETSLGVGKRQAKVEHLETTDKKGERSTLSSETRSVTPKGTCVTTCPLPHSTTSLAACCWSSRSVTSMPLLV
jgi:hypothetical protein